MIEALEYLTVAPVAAAMAPGNVLVVGTTAEAAGRLFAVRKESGRPAMHEVTGHRDAIIAHLHCFQPYGHRTSLAEALSGSIIDAPTALAYGADLRVA